MSSINFVNDIEEARKTREDEWKKAYENKENPPPLKEPETYDPRTLYERLQEQKQKKDDAFAEATKLGNLIHRLDNDEFDFLTNLEQEEAKKKRELAEQEEEALKAFRMNVQLKSAPPPSQPASLVSVIPKPDITASASGSSSSPSSGPKKRKTSLFAGLVKRDDSPSSTSTTSSSKPSVTGNTSTATGKRKADDKNESSNKSMADKDPESKRPKVDTAAAKPKPNALLSLVAYDSSSDDEE
ncbi:hypothetical protein BGZ54_006137 [Gamsiella multidivaricata]|nr:hypothetical protein BGZ54_006137 [Gamsiella multidivaricata]